MNTSFANKVFHNADNQVVEYDNSDVTWRVSAYVIVEKDSQILIIKNREELLYDILGGGIELGETINEAITREALEEGGAKVKIGKLLYASVDWFYHKRGSYHQALQLFYQATLVGQLQEPLDKRTVWREFVPIQEIGTKYPLPTIVEKVITDNFQM